MKQTISDEAHSEAWLDTPLGANIEKKKMDEAYAKNDPDHLLDVPGIHLKSKESRDRSIGIPKYFGKLTSYTDEEVVVISKEGGADHPCVWKGTPSEYRAMWMVD